MKKPNELNTHALFTSFLGTSLGYILKRKNPAFLSKQNDHPYRCHDHPHSHTVELSRAFR